MIIQHNIMAMSAYRNYMGNTNALSKNLEKLSSGYRINRAGDDAAGLAISEKMRAQITGLDAAQKNVQDGISLVQTAEGALQEVQDMLNRMVYLASQSANGTYDNEVDRANLQKEVDALSTEIDRIADSSNFNGINLLDGSLDSKNATTVTAESAISNITTSEYSPKGASDAISTSFIRARPAANTKQTNAKFSINLDAVEVKNLAIGDKITLNVGGTELSWTATAAGDADTAAELATKIATKGGKNITSGVAESADNATTAAANADTASWATAYAAATANTGKYVEIDGHYYAMAANGNSIDFTQVDFMSSGETVNADFAVSISGTDNTAGASTGTLDVGTQAINWQVQDTVTGKSVGSAQQARVEMNVDLTKLKDGDVITIGDDNFILKIGKDSTTAAAAGQTLVDLSNIFKAESDQADEAKQAEAFDKLVADIGTGSDVWTAGNEGVEDGVGKITFQSLSTKADDVVDIGGNAANGKVNMTTEANVMKQFSAVSAEAAAKTSFEIDPTAIKAGDTFTIDGKTFEFTDGTEASSSKNVAIDLSSLGIAGGLLASQDGEVSAAVKTAIEGDASTAAKYTVTVDGGKVTLTSKDDGNTPAFENRVAASVTLPTETTYGKGLTLQIGDNAAEFNQLAVNIEDMHVDALGLDDIDISTQEGAQAAIDQIKDAINSVSMTRGTLGATQNRLEHTANNLAVMEENIQDAESSIRDTDIAEEMMAYTKNNILIQSAQAMLAQANTVPQGVLQLLG